MCRKEAFKRDPFEDVHDELAERKDPPEQPPDPTQTNLFREGVSDDPSAREHANMLRNACTRPQTSQVT